MRIAIVNTDYAGFLKWHYGRHPELKHKTFAEQMAARNASMFGVADFYSRAFHALGHQAKDIHTNNANMQAAWAREEGMGEIARQLHEIGRAHV